MLYSEQERDYLLKWQPTDCKNALDLGCGDKKLLPTYTGIDKMTGTVARIDGSKYTVTPDIVCDVRYLYLIENGSVDYIVAIHTLEHLSDPVAALRHWVEKLRVGGRIGIIVPDYRYTWSCQNEDQKFSDDGHRYDYTPDELERVFRKILNLTSAIKILDLSTPTDKYSIGGVIEKVL